MMKKIIKTQFLIVLLFQCCCSYGLNIVIIESQSFNSGHNMDAQWSTVATAMGHSPSILPQATLDNNSFFSTTDILIISSGVINLPANRINTIIQFIQSGKNVYLQSEYLSSYSTNQAFAYIVAQFGGVFNWTNQFSGDLAPMNVLGTFSNTNNNVLSIGYYWYSVSGVGDCNVVNFLEYGNEFHGFEFIPGNSSFGTIITCTDQDWIRSYTSPALMQNIITHLITPDQLVNNITPVFTTLGPYCVGATPGTLPATSANGITGTWDPATISTATTGTSTYTFTPTAGQCANTTTMSVTVSSSITPTFTTLGPYCVGVIPGTLPATSTNGITGTWNPATISTATTGTSNYTFTPTTGQCATTTTMSVIVSSNITPAFTALGPYCTGATPGTLPTTSTNGITGTWNPATISTATTGTSIYTFTPAAGQCASATTMSVTVSSNIAPTFTALGPYCTGATPGTLPTTSTNSITGTWNPATISTATTGTSIYTFTPSAGQCASSTTMSVTVNPNITPSFTALGPYCAGTTPGTLPTTSTNGISGTWNPAAISTATAGTSIYTFTPSAGQCASSTTMSVTVNPNITPSFTALGPYCAGTTPGTLPTTSTNGISGTWNPAAISTATAGTSIYTFTPSAGQCASSTTMSVTVNPNITPSFTALGPYCAGTTPGTLPTTSTNGITGTWNPATINTATTGTSAYTFTPTASLCATTTTISVTVSSNITPTFTALGPYCVGATPGTLPTTSTNSITGIWSPATISTASAGTSTYTFTPTTGQCAAATTMSVTVSSNITPTFTTLGPYCVGATPGTLSTTSTNSINGTWSPTTISTATYGTTTYTFTPTAGQCAVSMSIDIVVNALPDIYASTSHTNICFGQSSEIYASGAANYVWQPGNM
ncbi:MAG TPA: hypothetical protein PKN48_09025, partial [Bacteroidales bacterium]|nr:hypothetical protein [Bacteroidales bacterium]